MEAYNDAVCAVAAELKVPHFDLARQLPKSGEYFYDDVHFNPRGLETVDAAEMEIVTPLLAWAKRLTERNR